MEKQPDIRIFIACHKPTYVPENPIFYPVQVGTALTEKRLEHMAYRDNEGDNISGKNPDYCELTAQYWAWKNIDCDYYGFFHYRRYLTFHRVCPVMASGRILGKRQHPYIELDSVWDDLTPYWMEAEWMAQQIMKYDLLTVYRERINTTVYGMAFYTFRYIRAGEKRDKQTAGTKAVWLSCGAVVWYLLLLPEEERPTMCRASLS